MSGVHPAEEIVEIVTDIRQVSLENCNMGNSTLAARRDARYLDRHGCYHPELFGPAWSIIA